MRILKGNGNKFPRDSLLQDQIITKMDMAQSA